MNNSRLIFLIVSVILVLPMLAGFINARVVTEDEGTSDSFIKYLSVFTEVLKLVGEVYVEETDIGELMAGALDGATDALDPFSIYVPADHLQSYEKAQTLGAGRSGLVVVRERGVVYVIAVREQSPAEEVEIARGDIISKLQGRSSRPLPWWEIQEILAGEPGTTIELELVRRGASREVAFELVDSSPPPARLTETRGVGVLRIPAFSPQTASEIERALAKFRSDKLIVDLRGVAGGDTELGYRIAELFARGELGVLLDRTGESKRFVARGNTAFKGDLAVLVDRGSQGPAEILAAILKQSADARLVGEKSFGYAGHPRLVKLSSGAALRITDGFYTGPDEKPLNESLIPDLKVEAHPVVEDETEQEPEDLILKHALDLLLEDEDSDLEEAA